MNRIYHGYSDSCQNFVRMRSGAFIKLAKIMRKRNLLKDSRYITVEEQLAITLNILGHKSKNRIVRTQFIRSGETVSRYFNRVLYAISCIQGRYMKQAPNAVAQEILNNPSYFPFFKDCIGMIDGTHVDAMLPTSLVARFRGRKGVTQNVLAACTPNKLFTYVLAGWEGSAHDYKILQDALSRPQPYGLRVYTGMGDKSTTEGLDLNNGRLSTQSPTSMAPPPTPTFSASSGFNHSFMPYQQSSQFVHPPYIFSNVHNYNDNYGPVHHPTMSYMNLLNSPPSFHQQCQGSNASRLVFSPIGATNITSDSGCNKRAATDEVVATSALPRMQNKARGTKKRKISIDNDNDIDNANVTPTRWWTSAHDEVFIPFLAKSEFGQRTLLDNFKKSQEG